MCSSDLGEKNVVPQRAFVGTVFSVKYLGVGGTAALEDSGDAFWVMGRSASRLE